METYRTSSEGKPRICFEIENLLISRREIAKLLKKVPGVTEIRVGGHFGSSNDVRISFKYFGDEYVVWEPFGDNSRYWIGPRTLSEDSKECGDIEAVFQGYRPAWLRAMLNELLSLKPLRRIWSSRGSSRQQ